MGLEPMASTLARLRSSQTELLAHWWTVRDSNPRPLECHSSALPTELRAHVIVPAARTRRDMVDREGFEPSTSTMPLWRSPN